MKMIKKGNGRDEKVKVVMILSSDGGEDQLHQMKRKDNRAKRQRQGKEVAEFSVKKGERKMIWYGPEMSPFITK